MILKQGDFRLISGYVPKDVQFNYVGEKGIPKATFSLKAQEVLHIDGTREPIWIRCECWRDLAKKASGIKKGDYILATGIYKQSEYNNNIYYYLECDYISAHIGETEAPAYMPKNIASIITYNAEEVDDLELPF